jgi:hypothetical protein
VRINSKRNFDTSATLRSSQSYRSAGPEHLPHHQTKQS